MKQAIIIFTRVPIAGQTKTRMMPYLNGKQCAKLHSCFLKDIRKECEKAEADLFVCYTPEDKKALLYKILGEQTGYFPQQGTSLGERMYAAFTHVFNAQDKKHSGEQMDMTSNLIPDTQYEKCLLIGTDVPELKAEYLKDAFQVLEEKDVVFGRTSDGGYYLVGMKEPRKEAFGLSEYGHANVWEETLQHLKESNITVGYTQTLDDMDTPDDLQKYWRRIQENKKIQKTQTARYLMKSRKISIIVPTFNEEKTILNLQKQLFPLKDKCEILFVDGGSTDKTLELISPEFKLIHSEKGRAKQMNAGALASTGDILFFLHCDSELPKNPLAEIRYVMKDHLAGCFGIAFHSRNFFMFTCRIISNHRIKDRKVMFGDQGIFVDRQLFFKAGMYPDLPIMEDYQFSLTLKEMKIKLGIAKHRIYTSDRRFPKGVIPKLKVMWKMNRLRKMYRDGVDINKISDMYRDVR